MKSVGNCEKNFSNSFQGPSSGWPSFQSRFHKVQSKLEIEIDPLCGRSLGYKYRTTHRGGEERRGEEKDSRRRFVRVGSTQTAVF